MRKYVRPIIKENLIEGCVPAKRIDHFIKQLKEESKCSSSRTNKIIDHPYRMEFLIVKKIDDSMC